MEKVLKKLGLSDKEIQVYLTLLEYGTRPASFIASKTGFNRGTTYNVLETLKEKKIVFQTVRADVWQFSACDPEKLLDYIEQEKQRIDRMKSEVEGILPDLENVKQNLVGWQPKFRYFEGTPQMRDLLEMTLRNQHKELYAILSITDLEACLGADYYEDEAQRRKELDIALSVIRSDKKDPTQGVYPCSSEDMRDLRFMPEGIAPPDMSFYLWDERYCAFFASKKENYGLLIESPEFYQTQKTLWNSFWNVSTEI